jgi:hypothetical protein
LTLPQVFRCSIGLEIKVSNQKLRKFQGDYTLGAIAGRTLRRNSLHKTKIDGGEVTIKVTIAIIASRDIPMVNVFGFMAQRNWAFATGAPHFYIQPLLI